MADESQYSSGTDTTPTTTSNKRKYDDQITPSSTRRPTGFSSPDSAHAHAPPSYNSVAPPDDEIQLAKQKAQEIAARLLSVAGAELKRPKVENGSSGFDSNDNKGFSSAPNDIKSLSHSAPTAIPVSYGSGSYMGGSSKKIDIPNGRVGVIIGKGGETIKYLQNQSGAKIQVTRDMDADPNSQTRMVELMGTPDQIARAEELINEVLAEADAGGSGTVSRRFTGQGGSEHFVMKIPNNKVGLVIGKGGDTIKQMQNRTYARIQVIPLHLPPGDTSTERNVHIEGTSEQIEHAKQLINEVISENRSRNQSMGGSYPQQGYQTRPQTSWGAPGAPPMQQPGYGYMQPGGYPGPSPQYMSQPPYAGYPPQPTSGGYSSSWDQSNASANPQTSQGYDYYSQSSQQQATPGGPGAPADSTAYNYGQPPASGYNQQGQGYAQDGYGGYPPQSSYGQAPPYDQQQGYTSAPNYSNVANATQEGHNSSYAAQGDSAQASSQPPAMGQQGYTTGQQPSPNPSYPPQGATQPGYGPASQSGYGSQQPAQPGYGSNYGPPQAQKPPVNPPVYGQTQQSPSTPGGYGQPAPVQSGYPHSQPPPSGYTQPDSGPQRAAPSGGYGSTVAQPGYGPPYGSAPAGQSGYGQAMPSYNTTYGGGYSQPAVYSADGNGSSARASYDGAPASQPSQQSGVAKTSPQS